MATDIKTIDIEERLKTIFASGDKYTVLNLLRSLIGTMQGVAGLTTDDVDEILAEIAKLSAKDVWIDEE